jgi:hypothetical protein
MWHLLHQGISHYRDWLPPHDIIVIDTYNENLDTMPGNHPENEIVYVIV